MSIPKTDMRTNSDRYYQDFYQSFLLYLTSNKKIFRKCSNCKNSIRKCSPPFSFIGFETGIAKCINCWRLKHDTCIFDHREKIRGYFASNEMPNVSLFVPNEGICKQIYKELREFLTSKHRKKVENSCHNCSQAAVWCSPKFSFSQVENGVSKCINCWLRGKPDCIVRSENEANSAVSKPNVSSLIPSPLIQNRSVSHSAPSELESGANKCKRCWHHGQLECSIGSGNERQKRIKTKEDELNSTHYVSSLIPPLPSSENHGQRTISSLTSSIDFESADAVLSHPNRVLTDNFEFFSPLTPVIDSEMTDSASSSLGNIFASPPRAFSPPISETDSEMTDPASLRDPLSPRIPFKENIVSRLSSPLARQPFAVESSGSTSVFTSSNLLPLTLLSENSIFKPISPLMPNSVTDL